MTGRFQYFDLIELFVISLFLLVEVPVASSYKRVDLFPDHEGLIIPFPFMRYVGFFTTCM
jgi:hypothetical protein